MSSRNRLTGLLRQWLFDKPWYRLFLSTLFALIFFAEPVDGMHPLASAAYGFVFIFVLLSVVYILAGLLALLLEPFTESLDGLLSLLLNVATIVFVFIGIPVLALFLIVRVVKFFWSI